MSLNPLEQLNLLTVVSVAAIFVAAFLLLRRLLFLPLLAIMEGRARKLEAATAADAESRALVERAQADAARIVAEARAAAERVDKEVKDGLLARRDARIAEAGVQARDIAARGRELVSRLAADDEAGLEEQLLACSRQALLKMMGEVDDAALRGVVSLVVAGREAAGRP